MATTNNTDQTPPALPKDRVQYRQVEHPGMTGKFFSWHYEDITGLTPEEIQDTIMELQSLWYVDRVVMFKDGWGPFSC